ncbi:MAG: hypothetical protein WCW27_02030 [Patescibacteria group bacterium]|jgi:hypothetical protein
MIEICVCPGCNQDNIDNYADKTEAAVAAYLGKVDCSNCNQPIPKVTLEDISDEHVKHIFELAEKGYHSVGPNLHQLTDIVRIYLKEEQGPAIDKTSPSESKKRIVRTHEPLKPEKFLAEPDKKLASELERKVGQPLTAAYNEATKPRRRRPR